MRRNRGPEPQRERVGSVGRNTAAVHSLAAGTRILSPAPAPARSAARTPAAAQAADIAGQLASGAAEKIDRRAGRTAAALQAGYLEVPAAGPYPRRAARRTAHPMESVRWSCSSCSFAKRLADMQRRVIKDFRHCRFHRMDDKAQIKSRLPHIHHCSAPCRLLLR